MKRRAGALAALLLLPAAVSAGHGLLNSFNDLEWLPAPGRTPDQWQYRLDTWREEAELLLAADPRARLELCQRYMRDKLAELEAMLAKEQREAADIAVARYRRYLEQALAASDSAPAEQRATLRAALALALLEHQYMLSVDYPDLPSAPRAVLASLIDELGKRYGELRATLPRASAESLFFKEEEVRWSWEMAKRAGDETR